MVSINKCCHEKFDDPHWIKETAVSVMRNVIKCILKIYLEEYKSRIRI